MTESAGEKARHQLADPIDRRIALALRADGRSTLKALAEITGLSVSAVQARVRRLEASGVISGYTALLDPESIGLPLAALIAITPLDPAQPDDAPERIAGLTEIEACHSVAGDDAYVLFVRVASPTRAGGADPRDPQAGQRLDPHHRRAADVLRAPGRAAQRAVTDGRRSAARPEIFGMGCGRPELRR